MSERLDQLDEIDDPSFLGPRQGRRKRSWEELERQLRDRSEQDGKQDNSQQTRLKGR